MTSPLPTGYGTATIQEWNLAAAGAGAPVGAILTVDFDPKSLQLKYAVTVQSPGQQTQTSGPSATRRRPSGRARPPR